MCPGIGAAVIGTAETRLTFCFRGEEMQRPTASRTHPFLLLVASCLMLCAGGAQAQQAKYKAIWEPVNYPDDFNLRSVYFVNDRVGWVGGAARDGKGGIILYTADAGERWDIQLGDPKSDEEGFHDLYFLDATHGWARQNDKLLRTTDGKNWEDAGSFPKFQPFQRYVFTTPHNGIEIAGYANDSRIFVTRDGGRSWKESFQCVTTLRIQGLTKNLACHLNDLAFPSARVGYAVGGAYNGGFSVIAKTEDGGATWRMIFASADIETIDQVFFTDDSRGVIQLRNRKILATEDGGQTWRGLPGSAQGPFRFADPAVGWSCYENSCSITTDGGQRWTSRAVPLPAQIQGYSVPRRDRVFVVGDHGMIYRYRIVPSNYAAKAIVDAPLVPGYGVPLLGQLDALKKRVSDLQAKLAAAPAGGTNVPASAPAAADAGVTQDMSFSQVVLATPPSAPVGDCCSAQVIALQSELNGFSKQVPGFAGNYRNLNLLFVGQNMLSDLNGRAAGLRGTFLAVKNAANLQAAAAALQDFAAKLDDTSVAVSTQFQALTANDAGQAGGAVSNMLANPSSGSAAPGTPAGNAAPASPSRPSATDQVTDEVKRKLKRFLPF